MAGVERIVLANGLRVVIDRHERLGTAAVTVLYGVGGSSDRPGQNGLAHVVEHLMFQGSANFGALSHFSFVQGLGGQVNGQTHFDFTEYYQQIPAEDVDQLLVREADRMQGFVLTPNSYLRELEVVKEEVRTGQNHPFRSFPWKWLAPLLFENLPDGYDAAGGLEDIEALTLRQAEEFFAEHYGPGNAVIALSGELDESVVGTISGLFGEIGTRAPPAGPRRADVVRDPTRRRRLNVPAVPVPACAVARCARTGGRARLDVALELLASLLASRMNIRAKSGVADGASLRVSFGMFDEGLNCLSPPALALCGLGPGACVDPLAVLLREELESVAAGRIAAETLEPLRKRRQIALLQMMDSPLARSRHLAVAELKGDDATEALAKSEVVRSLSRDDLADAATVLLEGPETSIELVNGEGMW